MAMWTARQPMSMIGRLDQGECRHFLVPPPHIVRAQENDLCYVSCHGVVVHSFWEDVGRHASWTGTLRKIWRD